MIVFQATGRRATARATEPVTTGSVGIPVEVELSADFDGLQAVMVFSCGHTHADVALMGDAVEVPAQLLRVAGQHLHVGVYATLADGTVVIPTVWANAGTVQQGVAPSGVDPASPAPSWAAQIQAVAREAAELSGAGLSARVTSLDETQLTVVGSVVEAHGAPTYVSDVGDYESYGITETGWYVFARVAAPEGCAFDAVDGADGSVAGTDHVDVAVRFDAAALSRLVTIGWDEGEETLTFRATDLAVRNLDYRTTFYIYDLAPYTTWEYKPCEDEKFSLRKGYFTLVDGEYVLDPDVVAGDPVPADTYHVHSKLVIEGMARNVTYALDTIVDCPIEVKLPDIPDDGYGAWYELQMRYQSTYSLTLTPESSDVKAATDTTPAQSSGINILDLHYASIAGKRVWRLVNTHSSADDPIESIAFRTPPTKTEYVEGETLDTTGAEVVLTYADGARTMLVYADGTTAMSWSNGAFTPASGTALTVDDTELTASYTSGGATVEATVPLTVAAAPETESENEGEGE